MRWWRRWCRTRLGFQGKGVKNMKGTVLDFNSISGGGVISCEAGNRYTFTRPQWKSAGVPVPGVAVDFVAVGNEATDVYVSTCY